MHISGPLPTKLLASSGGEEMLGVAFLLIHDPSSEKYDSHEQSKCPPSSLAKVLAR
jgi:hypothetical protein